MSAQVFTCCDLSISLVLLNLFSLQSETFHEISNHIITILLSVTFYLRRDLTLRGLQDNQEKISSPQISFVLWMLKLLDCGIWKARHSQQLDILFCVFTQIFYMVSNIAEWSACKEKLIKLTGLFLVYICKGNELQIFRWICLYSSDISPGQWEIGIAVL